MGKLESRKAGDWSAKGQRNDCERCLDCGADARLAHFDCTSSHNSSSWKAECCVCLRRPRLCFPNLLTGKGWKLQAEAPPPNSAIGPQLDGDWTSFTGEALPIRAMSFPSSFQVWMEEGQRLRQDSEKRSRNSSDDQRCSAIGPCEVAIAPRLAGDLGGHQAK